MVYKSHKIWRDILGIGAGLQSIPAEYNFDKYLKNLKRSHPRIPYTIEVECSSYWGNFDREFVAYSMGILDDVQMSIHHSEDELEMFWADVYNSKPIKFKVALEEYELLRDYLFETFQDVDDWYQLTFYNINWPAYRNEKRNILRIQLAKPLNEDWENTIIPRMKAFFDKKIYEWMPDDTELIGIWLLDRKGNVVKEY